MSVPISIKTYDFEPPKLPKITCDLPLDPKLNDVPILRGMNCNFIAFFLGNTGSGKTSTFCELLLDKRMFNEVFDKILWVIPRQSLESLGDSKLKNLPEDQIYHELTIDVINEIGDRVEQYKEEGLRTLLVLDDVQQHLKGACEARLNFLVANHRHYGFSVMILCQTYRKCPKTIRMLATHLFTYNLSNGNYNAIHEEVIHWDKRRFDAIVETYKKFLKENKKKKAFLFFDLRNNTVFIDWNKQITSDLF